MKKRFVGLALISLLVFLTALSCAGTPPAEETAPPSAPPSTPPSAPPADPAPPPAPAVTAEQLALDALNAAAARAAAAKQRAADFEGESLFPSDWDSAESLLGQAEQQRNTSTLQSTQESASRYDRAADAFDDIFERALAAGFELAERELIAARNAAIAAGAEEHALGLLSDADSAVARALEEFDAGNYSSARSRAEAALLGYEQAASAAWVARIADIRSAAAAERQRALDVRANVAARDLFDPAEAIFNRANTNFQGQRIEEAARLYEESRPMFISSAQLATERRLAAEEALRRADQRLVESDETARVAEDLLIQQGGMR